MKDHDNRCPWAWDYMEYGHDMGRHPTYVFPDPPPSCNCNHWLKEDAMVGKIKESALGKLSSEEIKALGIVLCENVKC